MKQLAPEELFELFLEHPSDEQYRAVRAAIGSEPSYRGDWRQLAQLAELVQCGQHSAVPDRVADMMPDWALSPRVHGYAIWAAEQRGDWEDAELERFMFAACVEGMLATGDGTPGSPIAVMHISDPYDVATALGLRPCSQRLNETGSRRLDCLVCEDGGTLYFDVSGLPWSVSADGWSAAHRFAQSLS